jgi:hypothetical protein
VVPPTPTAPSPVSSHQLEYSCGMVSANGYNNQVRETCVSFERREPPSLPQLGTRPDTVTCLTSLSRDTLLTFLRISTGNGPHGSTAVTSQGQHDVKRLCNLFIEQVECRSRYVDESQSDSEISVEWGNMLAATLLRVICPKMTGLLNRLTDLQEMCFSKNYNDSRAIETRPRTSP